MDGLSSEWIEIVLRLVVATAAGMLVGINRDLQNKPIGMRTLGIVALSAAMLVLSGSIYGKSLVYDQDAASRVIQGILTGLGFLGAGVILRDPDRMSVKGLTTAATVWLAAALGVTAGLGAWLLTAAGCVIALVLLVLGKPVEASIARVKGTEHKDEETKN